MKTMFCGNQMKEKATTKSKLGQLSSSNGESNIKFSYFSIGFFNLLNIIQWFRLWERKEQKIAVVSHGIFLQKALIELVENSNFYRLPLRGHPIKLEGYKWYPLMDDVYPRSRSVSFYLPTPKQFHTSISYFDQRNIYYLFTQLYKLWNSLSRHFSWKVNKYLFPSNC